MVLFTVIPSVLSVIKALNLPEFTLSVPLPRFQNTSGGGFPSSLKHLNTAVVPSFAEGIGDSVISNVFAPTIQHYTKCYKNQLCSKARHANFTY